MKLIPLTILLTSLAVDVIAQKFRQEQFPFPPQFPAPGTGVFASDNTLYLPPESQGTIPYFTMKNPNLQFPYLPPIGTKAPAIYPSPLPFVISTTLVPNFEDEDDDDGRNHNMIRMSTPKPQNLVKMNHTVQKAPEPVKEKMEIRQIKDMRTLQQLPFRQAMDRIDTKLPSMINLKFPPSSTPASVSQAPAARRMIISAENQGADLGLDQIKAAAFHGSPFIQSSGLYIPPSTTEPAIPILRLSNEMDLDGSFSYEALGADQTHYVQHSRMENMGTDKEEQVVEGSYSYVGDNGQTFTVHYVADANGFRASGDHLPVAPPVPEIIQRAVQYNLAEEAKRPPHLKSWQNDGRDNEIRESETNNNLGMPPPRNLFTGRTPEAFSYSYSQGTNTQNNLLTSASTQTPVKTVDYTTEQTKAKPNNGPISPQITFLASQGAHVPSLNSIQDTISRMFTTEKPVMPQLVNYEAGIKETDQDANKGLWRWQYGISANNLNSNNNKQTISRSFGEDDDVMINFSDMTQDQYTKMIQSQFKSNPENIAIQQYVPNQHIDNNQNVNFHNYNRNEQTNTPKALENQTVKTNIYTIAAENKSPSSSTEKVEQTSLYQPEDWFKQSYHWNQIPQFPTTVKPIENRDPRPDTLKLLTQKHFLTPTVPSQIVTQSYNFEDVYYEPRKLSTLSMVSSEKVAPLISEDVSKTSSEIGVSTSSPRANILVDEVKTTTTEEPQYVSSAATIKLTDFIIQDSKNDFWPLPTTITETQPRIETTTTESVEDIVKNNIFLKKIFMSVKPGSKIEEISQENKVQKIQIDNNIPDIPNIEEYKSLEIETEDKVPKEPKNDVYNFVENHKNIEAHTKLEAEHKTDKVTKLVPIFHPKPTNEIKVFKKKPIDIAEILNYVSMKNQFESSKMKPKSNTVSNHYDHRNEIRFIPIQQESDQSHINVPEEKASSNLRTINFEQEPKQNNFKILHFDQEEKPNNFRTLNHEQEVRGNIKNYKVLHRSNNVNKYNSSNQLKTELSPPPLKAPSLPPLGRAGPSMKSYLPPIYV